MRAIILIPFLILVSCKENGGTETGSPMVSEIVMNASRAYKIVEAACKKVVGCNIADGQQEAVTTCVSEQMLKQVYAPKLGLPIDYNTWSLIEVIYAEYEGDVVSEETAKIRCISDVNELICTEAVVQDAYDPSMEKKYSSVHEILPQSCTEVF